MQVARATLCLVIGLLTAAPYVAVQHDRAKLPYSIILFVVGTLLAEKITRRAP